MCKFVFFREVMLLIADNIAEPLINKKSMTLPRSCSIHRTDYKYPELFF